MNPDSITMWSRLCALKVRQLEAAMADGLQIHGVNGPMRIRMPEADRAEMLAQFKEGT